MKITNIFLVRSNPDPPNFKKIAVRTSPDPAKFGFSPDPVRSSPDPCSSLTPSLPYFPMFSVDQRWSLSGRDDHYPVCRLDIRQDSEFATGYGYPKSALKRKPDMDPDIRNAFIDISRIQTFGKSCTLHNHSFIIFIQKHLFSHLCHESESIVYSLYHSAGVANLSLIRID